MAYVRIVAPVLYLLVNGLFVLKYGLRVGTVPGLAATAVYLAVAAFLLRLAGKYPWTGRKSLLEGNASLLEGNASLLAGKESLLEEKESLLEEKESLLEEKKNRLKEAKRRRVIILGLILGLGVLFAAQLYIDPWRLNVDRWSAIHNFLSNLFQGVYPYSARTHLGGYGSPFPVWQLLHVPFYLLGDVGLSLFATYLFLLYALSKVQGRGAALCAGVLLLCSPGFVYEALVRSDLVTNFMFVCAVLSLLVSRQKTLKGSGQLFGILIGLLLSTRLSTGVVWFVLLLRPFLQLGLWRQFRFLLVVSVVFALTFVPFAFWDGHMLFFFTYNPFVLQTRQGSPLTLLLFLPVLVSLALTWGSSWQRLNFHVALSLLLLVVVTFVVNMSTTGTWDELFQSRYDITYFNMSLPFLCAAMSVGRCDGRVRVS